jgi:hypothetical protein
LDCFGRLVSFNCGIQGEVRGVAAALQRQLGQREARRREAGPLRGRTALRREREAADPGRVGGFGQRTHAQLAARRGNGGEAVAAARLGGGGLPERGEGEAVAVGLLEAEGALPAGAGGEDRGRRVDRGVDLGADARQDRAPFPPSEPHGLLHALTQRVARGIG